MATRAEMYELLKKEIFETPMPEEQAARMEQAKKDFAETIKQIQASSNVDANEQIGKKTLEKQLQLLSKCSEYRENEPDTLCNLSMAMVQVYLALNGQSRSIYGAENLPCAVQLPVKDLVALYAERADNVLRQAGLR